eukprot:6175045-Pleurochrysis_carterae.AAC.2
MLDGASIAAKTREAQRREEQSRKFAKGRVGDRVEKHRSGSVHEGDKARHNDSDGETESESEDESGRGGDGAQAEEETGASNGDSTRQLQDQMHRFELLESQGAQHTLLSAYLLTQTRVHIQLALRPAHACTNSRASACTDIPNASMRTRTDASAHTCGCAYARA